YIPNFQSFRKVECIVKDTVITLNSDENITLKVFNPYTESIELSKLKFAVTYMDNYKIPKETLKIAPEAVDSNTAILKQQDTTNFSFHLPKTKMENIGYFRVVISENNLYFGLNGKPIPIK
ncbi:MAG: 4-amino-4-deoxy-L-arabinose transferase, partial [Maribacter arcticus]